MNDTENFTENSTYPEDLYREEVLYRRKIELLIFRITTEMFSVLTICCLVVNIFACFVIFKHQRLRQDSAYKIIVNWFILNSLFMISSPLMLRVVLDLSISQYVPSEVFCIMGEMQAISLIGLVLFMILLTFHWYFKFYYPRVFSAFERKILYVIFGINTFLVTLYIQGTCNCIINNYVLFNFILTVLSLPAFDIFTIIIIISHFYKKKQLGSNLEKSVPFLLTNMFFFLYFMLLILTLLYIFLQTLHFFITICVASLFTLICPIYFFIILYRNDRYFSGFVRHLITCNCLKYTGDEFNDQAVHYNNLQEP